MFRWQNFMVWSIGLGLLIQSCNRPQPTDSVRVPAPAEIIVTDTPQLATVATAQPIKVERTVAPLPDYDTTQFIKETVDMFYDLAVASNGEAFFSPGPDQIVETLVQVIEKHGRSGADIVFLIDNTSSMIDDIEKIKSSLDNLLSLLDQYEHVRLAAATYGDMNADWPFWYDQVDLTKEQELVRSFIMDIKPIGGGDFPESVYDGLGKTIEELSWESGHKRMILILGDAPSLEPPDAYFSKEDIIRICKEQDIFFNLYPVIIGLSHMTKDSDPEESGLVAKSSNGADKPDEEEQQSFIAKLYPNPASDHCNIELNYDDVWEISVHNLSGARVLFKQLVGKQVRLELSDLPSGTYILKAFSFDKYRSEKQKFIIAR